MNWGVDLTKRSVAGLVVGRIGFLLVGVVWFCLAGFAFHALGSLAHSLRAQAPVGLDLEVLPDTPPHSALAPSGRPLAKHEPRDGCYLGAFIDLDGTLGNAYVDETGKPRRLPEAFESIVGKRHAMYFFYMGYGQRLPMDWVKRLSSSGKFVHIALEPNNGLGQVQNDAYLRRLADDLYSSGAKVFLRFASEMNGAWPKYGGNPKAYIEKFQLVASVMHRRAPNVAMVWCPYAYPTGNMRSYYPGDEAVDWVGVNMYSVTYFNQDPKTPAHTISPMQMLRFAYRNFAKNKPMMVCEYGATHYSKLEDKEVTEFAVRNIRDLYASLRTEFRNVKAINYFNTNNLLLGHRRNNDYSVTNSPAVLKAYRKAIASSYFITKAPKAAASVSEDPLPVTEESKVGVVLPVGVDAELVRFMVDGAIVHAETEGRTWFTRLKRDGALRKVVAEALDRRGRVVARTEQEMRLGAG